MGISSDVKWKEFNILINVFTLQHIFIWVKLIDGKLKISQVVCDNCKWIEIDSSKSVTKCFCEFLCGKRGCWTPTSSPKTKERNKERKIEIEWIGIWLLQGYTFLNLNLLFDTIRKKTTKL